MVFSHRWHDSVVTSYRWHNKYAKTSVIVEKMNEMLHVTRIEQQNHLNQAIKLTHVLYH